MRTVEPELASFLARESFAQRYYRWTLDECAKEVGSGLSRLLCVRAGRTINAVEEMSKWSADEQLLWMTAGVRARVFGEEPTGRALELRTRVLANRAYSEARRKFREQGSSDKAFDRKTCRLMVEGHLGEVFGSRGRDGLISTFWIDMPKGMLRTDVDFSGAPRSMRYWQSIYVGHHTDESSAPLRLHLWPISLVEWLGMGETSWEFMSDAVAATAAAQLLEWGKYFLRAAASLMLGD